MFFFSAEREAEVLYEVLFDEEFAGGLTIRYCNPTTKKWLSKFI